MARCGVSEEGLLGRVFARQLSPSLIITGRQVQMGREDIRLPMSIRILRVERQLSVMGARVVADYFPRVTWPRIPGEHMRTRMATLPIDASYLMMSAVSLAPHGLMSPGAEPSLDQELAADRFITDVGPGKPPGARDRISRRKAWISRSIGGP